MKKDEEGIYIDCELYVAPADGRRKKKCRGLTKFYNEENDTRNKCKGCTFYKHKTKCNA